MQDTTPDKRKLCPVVRNMLKIDFPFIRMVIPGQHLGNNLVEILGQKNQKVFLDFRRTFFHPFWMIFCQGCAVFHVDSESAIKIDDFFIHFY